jgi:hypothetical protein
MKNRNYIKEFLRRTSTKYAPTRQGLNYTGLAYPIYFKPPAAPSMRRVERFMFMRYGASLLDRVVLKYMRPLDNDHA